MGLDRKKLDPRKDFLFDLRQKFAEKCRAHGIEVEASSRYERGFTNKSKNTSVVQMRKRKEKNIHKDQGYFQDLNDKCERTGAQKLVKKIADRYQNAAQHYCERAQNEADKSLAQKAKNLGDLLSNHAQKLRESRSFAEQVLHKYEQRKAHERSQENEFER